MGCIVLQFHVVYTHPRGAARGMLVPRECWGSSPVFTTSGLPAIFTRALVLP